MSDVRNVNLQDLRQRLQREANRNAGPDGDGSLYLRALGCCWLAAEEGSAEVQQLEELFLSQAEFEGVSDPDRLITDIILGAP